MDIFPTMITPYKQDGSVDYDTAEKYVDWYYACGMTGVFAICQSSEIFFLTREEKVELNRRVYQRAKALEAQHGRKFTVVSSGHTSDTIEEQAKELNAVWESGTDALILITNRLDPHDEGDDVFIENAEKLLALLPSDVKLGFYECPYPYKRLVTPKILDWCLQKGNFRYMKDTCCDVDIMAERCRQLKGSEFKLLNANCQTLTASIENGADGYCGVMCNYHPKLYAWLHTHMQDERAAFVQAVITTCGCTVERFAYPLTAKYHMNLCGMTTEEIVRSQPDASLTEYDKACIRQMKTVSDYTERMLGI